MSFTNKDFVGVAVLALFLLIIVNFMKNKPAVSIVNREAPLPINQYTNGVLNGNTNDVLSRVNFLQQPVGNSYS